MNLLWLLCLSILIVVKKQHGAFGSGIATVNTALRRNIRVLPPALAHSAVAATEAKT